MGGFAVNTDWIKAQAQDFENIPLLDSKYIASVHLEDGEDELFWNAMLQSIKPGLYYFIYRSRAKTGYTTSGCTQCRQYLPYLSKRFFICIDSDHYLLKEDTSKQHKASDFVAQTYSYSWENLVCEKDSMHRRYHAQFTVPFNFSNFFAALSKELYPLLIAYLSLQKNGIKGFNQAQAFNAVSTTCSRTEISNNGAGFIEKINHAITSFLNPFLPHINIQTEKNYYAEKGLNEDNAYMHWQGHHLMSIVANVGQALCNDKEKFMNDVVKKNFPTNGHIKVDLVKNDLTQILMC
ncbi:MAG: DUF4435 domain-containing protein [Bacteroidaceae bacterium]|nr:DUF4435 domain-containing protein [Bacteroidaceae bacterium]